MKIKLQHCNESSWGKKERKKKEKGRKKERKKERKNFHNETKSENYVVNSIYVTRENGVKVVLRNE